MNQSQCIEAAAILLSSRERLQELSFGQECIVPLLDACAIVKMRLDLGPNRPPLIGFIGCTGTGKSTLFNSLIGKTVSSISWHAHNTGGPVLAADISFQKALAITNTQIFPTLSHKQIVLNQSEIKVYEPATGSPTELILCFTNEPLNAVFVDLPDINTTKSRDDNQVSLQLLPWLDTAVFLTDDETVYHRDYEDPVKITESLQQRRICVLVNRGRDKVDLTHHDLQNVRSFFQVEKIFTLPDLQEKSHYSTELEFIALQQHVSLTQRQNNPLPVLRLMAAYSTAVLKENQKRLEWLADLTDDLQKTIDRCLLKSVKIPMDKILQDEVLHVLYHLGLRRFAVSNVLHFLKSVVTTGSLFRSFRIAFGGQRNSLLENMLQFDEEKLIHEMAVRLADYGEDISNTIRQDAHAAKLLQNAPAFRALSEPLTTIETNSEFREPVKKILHEFEEECRQLLQSDTISDSVKNDPLVAVSIVVMLIADIFTLPGIGSFLLAPTAVSLLPMGKFESAKKKLQRAVRDVIQQQLLLVKDAFIQQKIHFTLDRSENVWKALNTCAALKESHHAD